jgi:hypothetical protein
MSTITAAVTYPIDSGSPFITSPAYSGTFIPSLWSGRLLEKFFASSTFAACSNTNWEGEISSKGDKVILRIAPDININDYEVGMTLSHQVPISNTIELVIDQGKYYAFQLNDVITHQADVGLMEMFSNDAGQQMKLAIDRNCWAACFNGSAAANKGAAAGAISGAYNMGTDAAPVTLDADNILENILAMASILDEQHRPDDGRFIVITPRERYLLMQSKLAQAYYTGDSTSPVRNGKVGTIDRFEMYISSLLPTALADEDWVGGSSPGTAARHAIVAGHKSAMTFAANFTKTETLRNPTDFGDVVRGLSVFGRRVVLPESLVTLVAAG